MNPTLDVIIPCYNAENTLQAAAESALAQSVVRCVWLVDDGSADGTRGVMERLAKTHPQICCEHMPQNGGAAKARNWGALQSGADFVAFLDADDVYQPEALAAAYMALAKFPYLGLVRLKLVPQGFPQHYLQHGGFQTAWRRLEMTVGGNMVFRRSLFLAAGGFPQHDLFRTFGGEDAALGIAFTRGSVVGTLFAETCSGVQHVYRQGIHAERLLDAALFGKTPSGVTPEKMDEAEAVTEQICRRLDEIKAHRDFGQTGVMALNVEYT